MDIKKLKTFKKLGLICPDCGSSEIRTSLAGIRSCRRCGKQWKLRNFWGVLG